MDWISITFGANPVGKNENTIGHGQHYETKYNIGDKETLLSITRRFSFSCHSSPEDDVSLTSSSEATNHSTSEAGDLSLLASLPQAPIPPHEFVNIPDCYDHHSVSTASEADQSTSSKVYSPEYISL